MSEARHCDDYINDPAQPDCLRKFLAFKRSPAAAQIGSIAPSLFANTNDAIDGSSYLGDWTDGQPNMQRVHLPAGQRVRVVMASRFGDVGITPNLTADHGYIARVAVQGLSNFGDQP